MTHLSETADAQEAPDRLAQQMDQMDRVSPLVSASSGAGAVTVLVLLLWFGGVDPQSGAALARAAHVLSQVEARQVATRQTPAPPTFAAPMVTTRPQRAPRTAGVRPRSVVDGTLPAPRAPCAPRVV